MSAVEINNKYGVAFHYKCLQGVNCIVWMLVCAAPLFLAILSKMDLNLPSLTITGHSCLHVPVLLLLPARSSTPSSTHCGSLAISPPWPAPDASFMQGLTNSACSIADLFMIAAEIETETARAKVRWLILLFIFAFSNVDVSGNKWPRLDYEGISKCIKILKHYKAFDFRTITVEFY